MMSHTALANLHRTRAIPNRGDSMRSRAADINTDRLAFDEAVETVMGPAATAQLEEALYEEFANQSGKAVAELSDGEKAGIRAMAKKTQSSIIQPFVNSMKSKVGTMCEESRRELLLSANEHTDDDNHLRDVMNKFQKLQDHAIAQYKIYKDCKREMARMDKLIDKIIYDDDGALVYLDEEDTQKVDQINTAIKHEENKAKRAKLQLHTLINKGHDDEFDEEGDPQTSRKNTNDGVRKPLKFNKKVRDCTENEITRAFETYLSSNCIDMWALVPWCWLIMNSFDKRDGSFKKPPLLSDDYMLINETIRRQFKLQSSNLYRDIRQAVGEDEMHKITTHHSVGLNLDIQASCEQDDGITALWCIYSKYAINATKKESQKVNKDKLRNVFEMAYTHFESGRPINKVEFLSKKLVEAKKLGVKLQSGKTMEKIIDALVNRGGVLGMKFIPLESKYAQVITDYEDDCSTYMESLFADINEICTKFESKHSGKSDPWGADTYVNQVDTSGDVPSQGPRGRGRGSRPYSRGSRGPKGGKGDSRGRGADASRGRGRGGRGRGGSRAHRCRGMNCHEPSPADKQFCTTCWKRGMEQGFILTFPNSEKFTVFRRRDDTKDVPKDKKFSKLETKSAQQAQQIQRLKMELQQAKKRKAGSDSDDDGQEENTARSAFNSKIEKNKPKKKRLTFGDDGITRVKQHASDNDDDEP